MYAGGQSQTGEHQMDLCAFVSVCASVLGCVVGLLDVVRVGGNV
jgi:hypothetical protein